MRSEDDLEESPIDNLESNSPFFNEKFLRQTLSQDIRYDSDERHNNSEQEEEEDALTSAHIIQSNLQKKILSKSNSQIYSLKLENNHDQISDVQIDLVDKAILKRNKSFCQRSILQSQLPYENLGDTEKKRSLVV